MKNQFVNDSHQMDKSACIFKDSLSHIIFILVFSLFDWLINCFKKLSLKQFNSNIL